MQLTPYQVTEICAMGREIGATHYLSHSGIPSAFVKKDDKGTFICTDNGKSWIPVTGFRGGIITSIDTALSFYNENILTGKTASTPVDMQTDIPADKMADLLSKMERYDATHVSLVTATGNLVVDVLWKQLGPHHGICQLTESGNWVPVDTFFGRLHSIEYIRLLVELSSSKRKSTSTEEPTGFARLGPTKVVDIGDCLSMVEKRYHGDKSQYLLLREEDSYSVTMLVDVCHSPLKGSIEDVIAVTAQGEYRVIRAHELQKATARVLTLPPALLEKLKGMSDAEIAPYVVGFWNNNPQQGS